jgi:flagellin-like hook-associated protein FlgL
MAIIGIPSTRISDQFVRQILLGQVQTDQTELFRLQMQLSTGRQFELPSESPVAALRVMSLQRLLERKDQIKSNLTTNQSYLSATDTAMSQISGLMAEVRGVAVSVIGTTADDVQRQAAAQQVQQALEQLMDAGNQNFRGRYLFAGSETMTRPFSSVGANLVRYDGNERRLESYGNVDLLFDTNSQGNEVFGAISDPVRGSVDLNPVVTRDTRLADLRGGRGVHRGSIAVSDGASTQIIDLSQAETVGDMVALIHAHPPAGNTINAEITPRGFVLQLAGGNLTITEVGGGTMAAELGILTEQGVGTNPVTSADLDPILRPTTALADVLGTKATAVLRPGGPDNDIIFRAGRNGDALNGVTISLVNDPLVHAGGETVDWDPVAKTLVIHIEDGYSEARDVVKAVNDQFDAGLIPFQAEADPLDGSQAGMGLIDSATTTPVVTAYGSGTDLDQDSGLQILNGGSSPYTIDISKAVTVEDLLNTLNTSPAGVLAEINETKTGIDLRSRLSGADFAIGENGGITVAQLGLRTFTTETKLADLNFGRGVMDYQGQAEGVFPADADFMITRNDGVSFTIDIHDAKTIGDVLDLINDNPVNSDPAQGVPLEARLAADGNGIELVDRSTGQDHLTVTRNPMSTAAIDLGLIPKGQDTSTATAAGAIAHVSVVSGGPTDNNGLLVRAAGAGTQTNGTQIVVVDTGLGAGNEEIRYSVDPVTHVATVTFDITTGVTTANDLVGLFESGANVAPEVRQLFTIGLDPTNADGSPNTGNGAVDVTAPGSSFTVTGGGPDLLTGADVNPKETDGLFTALLRLHHGLLTNDLAEMDRAVAMLDRRVVDFNFARAELGARQQGVDVLQQRLDSEEIELRASMSVDYDADFAEVASNLTARQIAYQASLTVIGQISQMSLLNYL